MGNINSKKRCRICLSKNKDIKTHICEECTFIPQYITKYGRENLKRILNNSYKEYEIPISLKSDNVYEHREFFNRSNNSEILNLQQPSAPALNGESTTDEQCENPISRCKSLNCSCKDRKKIFRTSVYNPPSYPYN
jgi:hypothetical protein